MTDLEYKPHSTLVMQQPDPEARSFAVLCQTSGSEAGRICWLKGEEVWLGRNDECTYAFHEESVSRRHVRLYKDADGWVAEDCNSRNGTLVNERPLTKRRLLEGDRLQLGRQVTLRFQMLNTRELAALSKLYESSQRDGLTGIYNRRHLDERLQAELAFAARHHTDLVVMLVDLDHFKAVNDTHGHGVGDRVLQHIASGLQDEVRAEDTLGRYGGEEFLIIARAIDLKGGHAMAERLRGRVALSPFDGTDPPLFLSVSIGVAALNELPENGRSGEELLEMADQRLYEAKETGRNQVVSQRFR